MRLISVARSLGTAAVLLAGSCAWSHGDIIPKRGGLVAWARELSVELVHKPDGGISVYVDDHGAPVSVEGASGSVNVLGRDGPHSIPLTAASPHRLDGLGAPLASGDKLQVVIRFAAGQVAVARLLVLRPSSDAELEDSTAPVCCREAGGGK